MAEETKTAVRLSKAAKEFNIGVQTVIEFLGKKGHEIDSNPNSKLTAEQYALLAKEYQSDKAVRQEAENIDLGLGKKKAPITVEDVKNASPEAEPTAEPEDEELRIKKVSLEGPAKKAKTTKAKAEPKADAPAEAAEKPAKKTSRKAAAEPVAEPVAEAAPAAEAEEAETPEETAKTVKKTATKKKETAAKTTAAKTAKAAKAEAEAEVEAVAEPAPEPEPEKTVAEAEPTVEAGAGAAAVEPRPVEEKPAGSTLRVVGKIDLSELSAKRRKERAAENAERAAETAADGGKPAAPVAETSAEAPARVETAAPAAMETAPAEAAAPGAPAPDTKPDNFIPTAKVTLTGPRLTGEKIDLGQFERRPKPVASSRDGGNGGKKKRQRVGEKPTGNTVMGGMNRPGGSMNVGGNNNAPGKNKKKKNNKNAHVQINEQEVEKTLKDTLARLSPLGKSKTSKHRREKRHTISQHMEEEQERMMQEQRVLKVTEFVTVNELATMMNVPVTDIISTCMSLGLFVSINQRLTADPISLLAEEYGYTVEFVDAEVLDELEHQDDDDAVGEEEPRTPIVTVMGHVDHGKTSLLDYIRKSNVIAGEAGGITQHIGAYEVQLENGKRITFLDTPGHEAFTAMRARGAKITDIAIIVVAADDKVMPQTVEAINHAQAAGVPIVFAINKIDKPQADPDKIKTELADMNLLVEEWGGKYQSQDISAKKGLNVDSLLEKVLLEAEMLDLKANPRRRAKGTVVESSLDKGRGYVAKILVQDGSVSVGDPIIAGATCGRVKAMYNERNQPVKKAGPSTPVLLLGLNGAPQAGDTFNVTKDEKEAKDIANRRLQLQREQGLRTQKHITLDEIGRRIAIGDFKELNVIVKGDVDGSIEALSDSLLKLSTEEVQVNVIHKSVGQITESDILLASASNAIIIGFQVRPSLAARKLAESEQIDIRLYSIIYDAINELKDAIEGMLSPEIQEKIVANLEVREVFKISKVGAVAGCIVLDGRLTRNTKVRIIRDGIVAYTGKLGSLRRFKDDVKEVMVGQDCGLNIENFNDIKVGDIIEGYEQTEVKRTL
ncbi:MAG: translation initiation factor IF-2 [Bacteroidales bacterium]|nr:translation initiation factor IF-2 [Bacteroidales bacterium]